MPPDDDVRLRHLVEAAETAIRFLEGRGRSDLDDDEMLRLALTKLVEIVGEAAKQVTTETRAEYPAVPWSAAAACAIASCTTTSTSTWTCCGPRSSSTSPPSFGSFLAR